MPENAEYTLIKIAMGMNDNFYPALGLMEEAKLKLRELSTDAFCDAIENAVGDELKIRTPTKDAKPKEVEENKLRYIG
jgi:hypothetical protein